MPRLAGARGAADAVDIRLGLHRQVVVDDMGDVVDVESARGDIGGDQHRHAAGPETVERAHALVLRLVAVDRVGVDARGLELAHQPVGAVLGLGEHHGAVHVDRVEQVDQQLGLLRLQHEVELLVDAVDRARHRRHGDGDRLVEQRVREVADLLRHGRREEHRLAVAREHRRDAADGLDEAHVEHAVGLVEHEELDLGEVDQALVEQVDQAARRRDQDIDALLDRAHLRTLPDAAEDDREADRRVPSVAREALRDLRRELTGGGEHERLGTASDRQLCAARDLAEQSVQDRQRERGGLAGAGLRDAEHVLELERGRDRLRLDRRGELVAIGDERVEDRRRELEAREGDLRIGLGVGLGGSGGVRVRNGGGNWRHKYLSPASGNRCGGREGEIPCRGASRWVLSGDPDGRRCVGARIAWASPWDGIKPVGARGASELRVHSVDSRAAGKVPVELSDEESDLSSPAKSDGA